MNRKITILIIEDDKNISRFLDLELKHEGYNVKTAFDGRIGLELSESPEIDLILLDVMLPGINGIEVCRRIRKNSYVPIIMLTAKDEITDRVMGLDCGADDYLTKPFAIEELLARMRTILRRISESVNKSPHKTEQQLIVKNLVVDKMKHLVSKDGILLDLSKKEFDLLVYLMQNEGIVLSREKIIENVWGYEFIGETNIVDVYIRYLRAKIDIPFNDELIKTIRGVGYTIR